MGTTSTRSSGRCSGPVEESERRIEALRACVAEAEGSLHDLGYLFTAEDDRISKKFAESNANRIEDDFHERVAASSGFFLAEIRSALGEVAASAERALTRAKERRVQGIQAVQVEVERINTLSDRLDALGLERKVAMP